MQQLLLLVLDHDSARGNGQQGSSRLAAYCTGPAANTPADQAGSLSRIPHSVMATAVNCGDVAATQQSPPAAVYAHAGAHIVSMQPLASVTPPRQTMSHLRCAPPPLASQLLCFFLSNAPADVTNCPGGGLTSVLTAGSSGPALLLLLLMGCSSRSLRGV